MLKLPVNTKLNKQLPKKSIYDQFNFKKAVRNKLDAEISRITIINEVSSVTTNIVKGENIEYFFVLLVSLKNDTFDEQNIVLLAKKIEQNMLFVLECGKRAKLAVYHGKLLRTDWINIEDLSIQLIGINFDAVWQNIIIQVSGLQLESGNTLDEQLQIDEQRRQFEKQLISLERKARAENQPRRKFELIQQIKKLTNDNITSK